MGSVGATLNIVVLSVGRKLTANVSMRSDGKYPHQDGATDPLFPRLMMAALLSLTGGGEMDNLLSFPALAV